MCAAISVPAPCPGKVSSTWITPVCPSMVAAHAHSYMLLHQWLPHPHRHGGTPKTPHRSASPCKTSLLLLKGSIPSSLKLSTRLISQLHAPLCALWGCGCAPHVFTSLHTYLSTPACEYPHVADLSSLVLFHSVPLHVFILESLAFSCQAPGTAQLPIYYSVFPFWGPLRWTAMFTNVVGQILE